MAKQTKSAEPATAAERLIPGGGEMGERIRTYDWDKTVLGPLADWPASLRTSVNILLQSPVPIVMLWGRHGIMLYNDAYSVFAGKRHPQLLGSKVLEGWPEVADFNRHVVHEGLAGRSLSYKDQQLTLYRNDVAEEVWMDLNYSPIIDDNGKAGGVWAIVVETSQRVKAEQLQQRAERALRAEQARLQSIFMQAPALIAVMRGPEHVFEMANPMYIDTVAPHRRVIGKPLLEAVPELAGQGIVEILDEVLRTNKPYVGELFARLDSKGTGQLEDTYFSLMYQPITGGSGTKPDGIFVHAVNITDQVLNRKQAEQLSAQLEAVFDSLPDGLYIADKSRITHINQRGAEALGYTAPADVPRELSELYRQLSVRDVQNDKSLKLEDSTLGNALQGIPVQHIGVQVTNPVTGKVQILRTAGAPIRDKDGTVIGGVAINSDLTELYALQGKVQAEAVRRRLLSQKTKLLKERNDYLTQLNATKDEFIALTSHQLRTPATGVKQYVAMLMQGYAGPLTTDQQEFLTRAYESNERQLHIIEDILRIAKLDLGELRMYKQPHDLVKLLKRILEEQSDQFAERQQELITDIPDRKVSLLVDANQLHMAIGNIVDNAIKYTADGKRITVRLKKSGTKKVRLEIIDEGVGIAETDMVKLFQKFSRVPNARSIEVGGTGLGLYWSRRIIELHGGTITVSSQLDTGTTFGITLPVIAD